MKRTLIAVLVGSAFLVQPLAAFAASSTTSQSTLDALMSKVASLEKSVNDLTAKLNARPQALLAAVGAGVPGTGVGQRAQTSVSVTVLAKANHSAPSRGTVPAGSVGTVDGTYTEAYVTYTPAGCGGQQAAVIAASCVSKTTYYYWTKVNFDMGFDGWVTSSSLVPAVSGKYLVGDRPITTGTVNVRSSPNGTIVGTQPSGASGAVTGNPVASGGYSWWPVNYDTGTDGWVAEQNTVSQGVPLKLPSPTVIPVTAPLSTDPATRASQEAALGLTDAQATTLFNSLAAAGAAPPSSKDPVTVIPEWMQSWLDAGGYAAAFQDEAGQTILFVVDPAGNKLTIETHSDSSKTDWIIKTPTGQTVVTIDAVTGSDGATYVEMSRLNSEGQIEVIGIERVTVTDEDIAAIFKNVPVPSTDDPYINLTDGELITPNGQGGANVLDGVGSYVCNSGICTIIGGDSNLAPYTDTPITPPGGTGGNKFVSDELIYFTPQ